MKKIGLCVRYDCNNYGSMLQILATQQSIIKFGVEYELLRYDKITPLYIIKSIPRLMNKDFMRGKISRIKKRIALKKHNDVLEGDELRKKRFSKFRAKYIGPYSKKYKGYQSIRNAARCYDAIMVGSDQLWAPAGIESNFYNLLFVPDNIRKIAYATSFGVSTIPDNQRKKTATYLKRIEEISVRENDGARIVKELTGRDAIVAVDPTLMLTCQEWNILFPPKKLYRNKYIFAYFLGDSEEARELIMKIKVMTGFEIVVCPHMDSYIAADENFGDIQRYDTDPEDFLNLIRGAEYVCTDSFHGSVFSILNHKQFVTFNRFKSSDRLSKNSRIESLLYNLGLTDRRFLSGTEKDLLTMLNKDIDYNQVEIKLNELRTNTNEFLKRALDF